MLRQDLLTKEELISRLEAKMGLDMCVQYDELLKIIMEYGVAPFVESASDVRKSCIVTCVNKKGLAKNFNFEGHRLIIPHLGRKLVNVTQLLWSLLGSAWLAAGMVDKNNTDLNRNFSLGIDNHVWGTDENSSCVTCQSELGYNHVAP